MIFQTLIGAGLSFFIAYIAYKRASLTDTGLFAAVFFATLIYVSGGFLLWSLLMVFFISSSLLTKRNKKIRKIHEEKQGRNHIQVIANAGVTTFFAVIYFLTQQEVFLLAAVTSIAASNADTWASEIGTLAKGNTFHILTFKKMQKGLSGGITWLGTAASALGALLIAVLFMIGMSITSTISLSTLIIYGLIISFGGFLGSIIDSLFGALFQAKYQEKDTGNIYEKKTLNKQTLILVSGFAIITNDMVNFLSTLATSILTVVIFG